MAPRRVTKAQPRRKQASEREPVVTAAASGNGGHASSVIEKNGFSPSFEQIQQRAYEFFEARGGTHGWDLDDWFRAEQELIGDFMAVH